MGPKNNLVVIDSNVFIIDLRYHRDPNFVENRRFLDAIASSESGATTIFNLLEVCGVLSFNLNERQLAELFAYFGDRYKVRVIPVANLDAPIPFLTVGMVFSHISRKTALGDALILAAIEQAIPGADTIVSWDKEHLLGKTSLQVVTPVEFMDGD